MNTMQKMAPAILAEGLRKRYGKTLALDGVTVAVSRGEALGIIGPNGAGKTTLMGCLIGLLDPTEGRVTIGGRSPHDLATKRRIGYVPERLNFSRWMTGLDFVALHAALCEQPADVEATLERVGLDRAAWKRPLRKYSRGMLQRTALAQALIGKPDVLFLDEPTSGIDPTGAVLFRGLMRELKRDGVTIVLNSHQLDQMEQICDRVVFMKGGRIEANESIDGQGLEERFLELEGACV
jgi:ABC-2 type transport system ATP-binding protein